MLAVEQALLKRLRDFLIVFLNWHTPLAQLSV
jgi:hypothetical protein